MSALWYVSVAAVPTVAVASALLLVSMKKKGLLSEAALYVIIGMAFLGISVQQLPVACSRTPTEFEAVLYAMLEALKIFTMNCEFDYPGLADIAAQYGATARWSTIYCYLCSVSYLLAPVLTVSMIVKLMRVAVDRFIYKLFRHRMTYYFSELNERSYILAKSICSTERKRFQPKPYLVFCKVDCSSDNESDDDYRFRDSAKKLGARFTTDTISDISYCCVHNRTRQKRIFLIDSNEGENVLNAMKIVEQMSGNGHKTTGPRIYVFSTEDSAAPLVDSLVMQLGADSDVELRLVNDSAIVAQELLLKYPLYEGLQSGEDISVMIVGCGEYGMEIARAAMSTGVMNNHAMKMRLLDLNGDKLEKQFLHRYPCFYELFSEGSKIHPIQLSFHKCDVEDTSFDDVLRESCADVNYIVVCAGDDERTMETARFLYKWYYREAIRSGNNKGQPKIYANIKNDNRKASFIHNEENIRIFGAIEELYSIERLENRLLDQLGMAYNYAYSFQDAGIKSEFFADPEKEQSTARKLFYGAKTVHQYSSQMAALHGFYKLADIGIEPKEELPDLKQCVADAIQAYEKPGVPEKLYLLEHSRWCVFQVLSGHIPFPLDKLEKIGMAEYKRIRDKICMHGCIVPDQDSDGGDDLDGYNRVAALEIRTYDRLMCAMSIFGLRAWLISKYGETNLIERTSQCMTRFASYCNEREKQ